MKTNYKECVEDECKRKKPKTEIKMKMGTLSWKICYPEGMKTLGVN
jgi:hypothetical protein